MAEEVLSILYAWDHDDVVQEKTNRKDTMTTWKDKRISYES
jgi:hypothetical protein